MTVPTNRVLALALALAALLTAGVGPAPAGAQAADEACHEEPGLVACRWTFASADDPGAAQHDFPLPVFPRTLATVDVRLDDAPDAGWRVEVVAREGGNETVVSASQHAQQEDASLSHRERSTHVLLTRPGIEYVLRLSPGHAQLRQAAVPLAGAGVAGEWRVTYVAEALPEGVAPSRPAATAEHPHLRDLPRDAAAPDRDVLVAWLDDARLGDGLMEAHLRVADLSKVTFDADALGRPAARVDWKVAFAVAGGAYYVAWEATPGDGPGDEKFTCALRRESTTQTETEEVLAVPDCAQDRATGTFHAAFPIRSIGSPLDGETFDQLTARSRVFEQSGFYVVDDDGPEQVARFALGGPDVWHALNPALTPPDPVAPAWHEAPLAAANIPETLQVVGAFLAALALVGIGMVVWRQRRDARRVLTRIDVIEAANEHDARQALVELGRLEAEVTRQFRGGHLREAQYQAAAQRIAAVAARFALRRDFGLDGAGAGAALGDLPGRRVPVQGEAERVKDAP